MPQCLSVRAAPAATNATLAAVPTIADCLD
eukprot:SAG11_NODE_24242_length_376_cov_0.851986_1_plen_29_part_10